MRVWIRDGRYFVELSNGVSFGIDRFGSAHRWQREPDDHVGRLVVVGRSSAAHIPARVQELIEQAEQTGVAPIAVAV